MNSVSAPARVPASAVRRRVETRDGGFEVGIAIDAASHGSDVLLGLQWVAPGTARVSWQAGSETHEVYHVVQGALRLSWEGPNEDSCDVAAGDSFFFPPGHGYAVENLGDEPAFVVWAMTPATEG
jgi:mannose-6-phosphate isomerase-like protein (cupin superfamily)